MPRRDNEMIANPRTHYGAGRPSTWDFIVQRITGAINLVVTFFFIWLVVRLAGAGAGAMSDLLANPIVAVVAAILIISVTMHMRIGMFEVIEDYVHTPRLNRLCFVLNWAFAIIICLAVLISLAKLVFWG